MLHGIEQREQTTPGVAQQCEPVETPLISQLLEIGHLLPPADRDISGYRRLAAAPLVVVDQLPPAGQGVESGEEIIVMGARAAV
jgi:hypothetical protein